MNELRTGLWRGRRRTPPALNAPALTARNMRIYVIGDIHGRLDLFRGLIRAIEQDDATRRDMAKRLVILGDFIDRGPQSAELVSFLMALTRTLKSVIVLKGNHEAILLDVLNGNHDALALWLAHGGRASLASWQIPDELTEPFRQRELIDRLRAAMGPATIAWLQALPTSWTTGDYVFVHAGIRPGIPLRKQKPEDLLWIRNEFLNYSGRHEKVVVHGHTVVKDGPALLGNRIAVDTGAYFTDRLCAVGLEASDQWCICP